MGEWFDLPELLDKAQELLELGLHDEALSVLDKHAAAFGFEVDVDLTYARIHIDNNAPEKALPYLQRCLRMEKTHPEALLGMFYAFSQMHNLRKASRYLLRAQHYHPDHEMVLSSLIWYYTEVNDLEKARTCFEKAKSLHSENPEMFRNAAIAYQRLGEYDNAEQCLRIAVTLQPTFDEARDLLADLYVFRGNMEKATELYRDYLERSPRNVRALSRLVFCYCQNDQLTEAAQTAQELISSYPNSTVGYVDLAYVHLNAEAYDQAEAAVQRALDISPIDAEAYRVQGIIFSEKGNREQAEVSFEKAVSLEPDNIEIIRDYYHHLRSAGDPKRMEALVTRAIKQEYPYCVEDYWFLADFYREQNQNVKAFHCLKKAYEIMPGEAELVPPMIDILLDEGHLQFSVPFLARYVERSGWNDIMNRFARHKRLRGAYAQEGLHLLRFFAQKPSEFRKFAFLFYLRKFLVVVMILLAAALMGSAFFLFGPKGFLRVALGCASVVAGWNAAGLLIRRLRRPQHVVAPS